MPMNQHKMSRTYIHWFIILYTRTYNHRFLRDAAIRIEIKKVFAACKVIKCEQNIATKTKELFIDKMSNCDNLQINLLVLWSFNCITVINPKVHAGGYIQNKIE